MSKKHSRIFWDPVHEGFFIENLSKNKIQVDGDDVIMNNEPHSLPNMSLIIVAKVKCWFLLPKV